MCIVVQSVFKCCLFAWGGRVFHYFIKHQIWVCNTRWFPHCKWRLDAQGPGGCNCNHTPRRKNTHRSTNPQPSHEQPPPPSASPVWDLKCNKWPQNVIKVLSVIFYTTCHTEARSSVEVIWKPWKGVDTLNQESRGREGNQEKHYSTRTGRHAKKALSSTQTQCRHLPWPACNMHRSNIVLDRNLPAC